jgi:transposase
MTALPSGALWLVAASVTPSPPATTMATAASAARPAQAPPALLRHRWKVERFFAWLNGFRRLAVRYERYSFMYLAFFTLPPLLFALDDFCNKL